MKSEGAGLLGGVGKAAEVVFAGNSGSAELSGDGGQHLDIEQFEAPLSEVLHEVKEGHFGGIADAMEHGFACEEASDGNAIDAADELFLLPAFDAVSVTAFMQLSVTGEELGGDPCSAASRGGRGAALHDVGKGLVPCDGKGFLAKHTGEASGNMKLVEFEYSAWVGRPPGYWVSRPREDS